MLARRLLIAGGDATFAGPTGEITVGSISTVTDNTKYNAWPVVCRLDNGNLLLGYTRADNHHSDNSGQAVGRISSDEGANWGAEFTIYDHASLFATIYGLSVSSSGRVFATLWRDDAGVSATGEAGIVYSDNDGSSWSGWVSIDGGFTQETYGAGPVVQVPNGDLLVTIEGSNSGQSVLHRSSHTLRSTDDGLTWGSEVTVRNYVTDTRPYYESKLLRTTGDNVLCVHRTSAGTGTHYVSRSTDAGLTWGAPTSEFDGYGAPSCIRTTEGVIVVVTRRNSGASVVAFSSIDGGDSFAHETVLDATMTEMEYGCPVELDDGRVLVVYGSQPTSSQTNADIKQVYLTIG